MEANATLPGTPIKRLKTIKLKQQPEDRLPFAEDEIPGLEFIISAAEFSLGNSNSAEQSQKDVTPHPAHQPAG